MESPQLLSHRSVVGVEQRSPAPVAERSRRGSRVGDVAEEHGGEDAFDLDGTFSGQELGDLTRNGGGAVSVESEVRTGQFDELRALDVVGEVAALCGGEQHAVSGIEHEGWHLDEGKRGTHVEASEEIVVLRGGGAGRRRRANHRADALEILGVLGPARHGTAREFRRSPLHLDHRHDGVDVFAGHADRVVVGHLVTGIRAHQDEGGDSVRVHRREQQGHGTVFRLSENGSPRRSDRIEDGPRILGQVLPRRDGIARNAVGHPRSTAIEDDEPAQGSHSGQELAPVGDLPRELQMASQAVEEQQVWRAIADDLIGDIGVTNRDVLGLRNLVPCHHEPSLLPTLRPHRHPLPCVQKSSSPQVPAALLEAAHRTTRQPSPT